MGALLKEDTKTNYWVCRIGGMQNNVLKSIIRHSGTLLCTEWQWDRCLSEYCGFPCQYPSANATNWYFIILPSTLLNLRNGQPLSFVTTEGQQNSYYCRRNNDYDNGSAYEQTPEYRNVCFCHLCSNESTRVALCTSHACLQHDKIWCTPEHIHMWCNHVFWTLNWLSAAWSINLSRFI